MLRWILRTQGLYFGITGLWPLVHMQSFLAVTGPKIDLWLVQTVGVLIMAISVSLFAASLERRQRVATMLLALLSATGLLAIDIIFVWRERISPVYLLDAAAEAVIIVALLAGWAKQARQIV